MTINAPNRICPECGNPFVAHHGRQVFCTTAHKLAFNNLMRQRGHTITPLAQVWRQGKRGTNEDRSFALTQLCVYLDACAADDKAAKRNPTLIVRAKRLNKWSAADLG